MLYRFPNMVVAQVTRESVQQAIASGITAQQVSLPGEGVGGGSTFLSVSDTILKSIWATHTGLLILS